LIGARRSTVTLALRELGERGDVLRQETGFLLVGEPAIGAVAAGLDDPELTDGGAPGWRHPELPGESSREITPDRAAIRASLRDLHEHHARTVASSREFLRSVRETQRRSREVRAQSDATLNSRRAT
jgi:hypothetical protein